jgi:hypothetical protein
MCYNFFY